MSSKQHSAKARVKKPAKRRNRRTRRVWVSRDVGNGESYNISSVEPQDFYKGLWDIPVSGYADCSIEPGTFEYLMGIKLSPGECRQFDMLATMTPVSRKGVK